MLLRQFRFAAIALLALGLCAAPAQPQEHPGCFMVGKDGQVVSLPNLCPGSPERAIALPPPPPGTRQAPPRIEFARLRIVDGYASATVTNFSDQLVSIRTFSVVKRGVEAMVFADLRLRPGQSAKMSKALVTGRVAGQVEEIINWTDGDSAVYETGFTFCKLPSGESTAPECAAK